MADIHHKFPVNASISKVFECISTPEGLDIWWGKSTKGIPKLNQIYQFDFGPGYLWEAKVSQFVENE
nr:SRPBCC domain-containing protein [Flammeovirgaceae bacterium]